MSEPVRQVELRHGALGDWDAFCELYESIAAEGRWIGGEAPVDWEARRQPWEASIGDPRRLLLFAEVDGRLVGWFHGEHQASGRVEVGMGILDGYRSMGIGTSLMAAGIGWAKHRGAHKITLELWPHNRRARGLYEKFGFEEEGRYRRHWRRRDGALWDAVGMGLVLDETSPGHPPEGADESP